MGKKVYIRKKLNESEIEEAYSTDVKKFGGNLGRDTDLSSFRENARFRTESGEEINLGIRRLLQLQDVESGRTYVYDPWNDRWKTYGQGPSLADFLKKDDALSALVGETVKKINPSSGWAMTYDRTAGRHTSDRDDEKEQKGMLADRLKGKKTLYELAQAITGMSWSGIEKSLYGVNKGGEEKSMRGFTWHMSLSPDNSAEIYAGMTKNWDMEGGKGIGGMDNVIYLRGGDERGKPGEYGIYLKINKNYSVLKDDSLTGWTIIYPDGTKVRAHAMFYCSRDNGDTYHIDTRIYNLPLYKALGKYPFIVLIALSRYLRNEPDVPLKKVKEILQWDKDAVLRDFWKL